MLRVRRSVMLQASGTTQEMVWDVVERSSTTKLRSELHDDKQSWPSHWQRGLPQARVGCWAELGTLGSCEIGSEFGFALDLPCLHSLRMTSIQAGVHLYTTGYSWTEEKSVSTA